MQPPTPDAWETADILRAAATLGAVVGLLAAIVVGAWLTVTLIRARSTIADLRQGNASLTARLLDAQSAVVRAVRAEREPSPLPSQRQWSRTELGLGLARAAPRGPLPMELAGAPSAATLPSVETMGRRPIDWEEPSATAGFRRSELRREQEALVPPSTRHHTAPVEPPPLPKPGEQTE